MNAAPRPAREIILINVSGEDRPGVTKSLSTILAEYGAVVLDIGQAVIHDLLTLGLLVEIPPGASSGPILKDLLFRAHELDMKIRFTPVSEDDYEHWVGQQGKPRHTITVLGRQLTAEHIAAVSTVLADQGLNIDMIHRLSGRIPLRSAQRTPYACVELSVRGKPRDAAAMRAAFLDVAHEHDVDVAFQADDLFRRNRRLVAFDMDSTLIQAEVIDELARAAGKGEEVAAITERAMRGELDFKQSLRMRLAHIAGLDADVLEAIAERLPLTEGAERLISVLKRIGFKVAILSGGFSYFGEHLQKRLGVDYVYANELEIRDGKLTGNVVGEIVDGVRKAELLREIALKENLSMEQVIAVGDGANDLPMLSIAGLGIAFRAKPIVKRSARQALSAAGLDGIL
ncbi:MAG: phosphoserine phosphatase SerB, partial [Vicinamibacterales bacterium]